MRVPKLSPPTPATDAASVFAQLRADLRMAEPGDPARYAALTALAAEMLAGGTDPQAPSRETLFRLGDRWSALLMFVLSTGRYRYAELQRVVGTLSQMGGNQPVSKRMLTLSLRVLERDGLVARAVGEGKVPPVDYWLTPLGEDLIRQLHALMRWCNDHAEHMRQAQRAFDAQHGEAERGAVIRHRVGQVARQRRS